MMRKNLKAVPKITATITQGKGFKEIKVAVDGLPTRLIRGNIGLEDAKRLACDAVGRALENLERLGIYEVDYDTIQYLP